MKAQESRMGSNRTGVQMSPLDAKRMNEQRVDLAPPVLQSPSAAAMADMRARYIAEAPRIGSVPPPGNVKGVVQTGMAMLTGNRPQLLLDKLGERLAFERSSTRLYDALITKVRATRSDGDDTLLPLDTLLQHRDEEAEHFSLLAQAIEQLGGDCTAQTPCADLAGLESAGLLQAVADPRTTVVQSLHALLIAEMADCSGWDMLIALTQAQRHDSMARDFVRAAGEERAHLQQVKVWFESHTLGTPLSGTAYA